MEDAGFSEAGLLKRYILQAFEAWLFQHQHKGGHHHVQGNVQVYNVRIPVFCIHETANDSLGPPARCQLLPFLFLGEGSPLLK